jgi:DNA processing protein
MNDPICAAAFALTPHIGWRLINRLLDRFGSLEAIQQATSTELQSVHGIGKVIATSIRAIDLQKTAADLARWRAAGIQVATWDEPGYPVTFASLEDRPLIVFWKGGTLDSNGKAIAIVGSRTAREESIALAYEWGAALASRGWTVISGLARGIDTAAHAGALKARGRTLAVLGSGVNNLYPSENSDLAGRIFANGAIVSEFAPDSPPSPAQLAFRNRLIAGLSQAVIVIEAGATSGAIYAAESARVQGHPVFALNNSEGNRAMLAQYARLLPNDADQFLAML